MTAFQIEQDKLARLYDSDGVPTKFRAARMSELWQSDEVVSRALAAIGSNRNLILYGRAGVGKTWLAVALLRGQMTIGVAGLFVSVPDLLARIRRSYGERGNNSDDLVESTINAPLLVLDDLGKERVTDWTSETLYRIVNHRNVYELPTIVTTNGTLAAMSSQLTYPVFSRLSENAEAIQFDGTDLRASR